MEDTNNKMRNSEMYNNVKKYVFEIFDFQPNIRNKSSYTLKHEIEDYINNVYKTNGYITNEYFVLLMKDLGFNSKQKSQSPYYYFNVKYKKFPCSLCNTSYFTYECCKKQFHEATKKHKMNVLKNKRL